MAEEHAPTLLLAASSLFSKWGFCDGEVVGEFAIDNDLVDLDEYLGVDEHTILDDLVRRFLLPQLDQRGFRYSVATMETSHNPIRIDRWNGENWDHYSSEPPVEVAGIHVEVPVDQVSAAVKRASFADEGWGDLAALHNGIAARHDR